MKSFDVYPAILTINDIIAQSQVTMASTFPHCPVVHIDVIDGWFADNITISPLDFPRLTFDQLQIDVHLMVEEPLDFVYELESVKEEVPVRSVIVQAEHVTGLTSVVEEIIQQGWKAGVSINVGTDVEDVLQETAFWLDRIALWQVMTVQAGFQGGSFHQASLASLRMIKNALPSNFSAELLVDGGITAERIRTVMNAGATGAVAGSYLWQNAQPAQQWQKLQETLASL